MGRATLGVSGKTKRTSVQGSLNLFRELDLDSSLDGFDNELCFEFRERVSE
jgi:hypothetical protein